MRGLLLVLLSAQTLLFAQQITLTGPATARIGETVEVRVNKSGAAITAIQFDGPAAAAIGAKAEAANKETKSHRASATDPFRSILYGLNKTAIADGELAILRMTIPAGTPAGSYSVKLANVIAVDGLGNKVNLTVGPALAIVILAISDLNGDGKTDLIDARLAVDQAIGLQPCAADQNGDGRCDVQDVQIVVAAIPGVS